MCLTKQTFHECLLIPCTVLPLFYSLKVKDPFLFIKTFYCTKHSLRCGIIYTPCKVQRYEQLDTISSELRIVHSLFFVLFFVFCVEN